MSEQDVRAATEAAYRAAEEHQRQGTGREVPEGDRHPLVPDGKNGRYAA